MSTALQSSTASLAALYRYPVKGMTGEQLYRINVEAGQTLPGDRIYAIENGPGKFSEQRPAHLPKINFVMLMRHARLAEIKSTFDLATHHLAFTHQDQIVARGDLSTVAGRAAIEAYLATELAGELRGPPRIVRADGHSFSDVAAKCVHIVNMQSIKALENSIGKPVDVRRFRPNLILDGFDAMQELTWIGKTLVCGNVKLKVFKRTERCQAVTVNPETAERDMDIVPHLRRTLGHTDCGIYATVQTTGALQTGEAIRVLDAH